MENDKKEINYNCNAPDIDRLRIRDGKVVSRSATSIQDPDNDITKNLGKCSAMDRSPPTYRVGPTFHTRLTNRSFSLENLKCVIQDQIGVSQRTSREHIDHKMLSNAVYEVWYFQKLEEARRRKKAQDINDQRKKEHSEKVKTEQKQKAEENFIEWKTLKNKQKQQQQKKKTESESGRDFRLTDGAKGKPNQEEAFLLWKIEKDKLIRHKKLKQKIQKETTKPDKEKKNEAEMVFKLWKKQADKTLKEKAREEERKKQEEEEGKKEKERLKQESAKSSFNAWKKRKDSELRNKIKEDKLAEEEKKNEKLMQQAERLYEAELVFEEWLTQIEERQNTQADVIRKQKQKNEHKLPWWPGGFVSW
ncbi:vicilin-like seed storage protein At2g18540 isoform X2 [Zootermopsis nevadensis]|uniref:vicilin-like seed storage protein At2g18540 isoform X2 n=1 Tax=Zootermopsis nevadensis TaxID=136037 RepID=UPI000B8E84BC|nr:vicilin-like seed storage protein At2g18540 isoform X2 [Zootermopsis nevadensis]